MLGTGATGAPNMPGNGPYRILRRPLSVKRIFCYGVRACRRSGGPNPPYQSGEPEQPGAPTLNSGRVMPFDIAVVRSRLGPGGRPSGSQLANLSPDHTSDLPP